MRTLEVGYSTLVHVIYGRCRLVILQRSKSNYVYVRVSHDRSRKRICHSFSFPHCHNCKLPVVEKVQNTSTLRSWEAEIVVSARVLA